MIGIAGKVRADALLVAKGLESSRERAKALIMEGNVYSGERRIEKPGEELDPETPLEVRAGLRYVSRGGLKLEKAVSSFGLSLGALTCMDVGASTGGFTDCMLQNGAERVYAVDVGYGQFAWKLRCDPRVVVLERTNVRNLTEKQVPELLDFVSVDVSFISLCLVLPVVRRFLKDGGTAVCLIKPQFEAGRAKVGKHGVVRDPAVHREVIERIARFSAENGFSVEALDFSPVRGPEGNIEYLMKLVKTPEGRGYSGDIAELVRVSHETLEGAAH